MKPACGCCDGTRPLTPAARGNRPGLGAISYRVGTHGAFLETMKARLSNWAIERPPEDRCVDVVKAFPLLGLRTRDGDDFSIALLDAWAMVADVLTFYQERIANEGYLRTATERRSVIELARLIGYTPRPGVASSAYLAYTLDTDRSKDKPAATAVELPAGSRAQSIPGPGELPQAFETSEPLEARDTWNDLKPRQKQPHKILPSDTSLYVKGTTTNLKPNDRLLLDFGGSSQESRRILTVEPDYAADRTKVTLVTVEPDDAADRTKVTHVGSPETKVRKNTSLMETLELLDPHFNEPAAPPAGSLNPKDILSPSSDQLPRLLAAFGHAVTEDQFYRAREHADVSDPQPVVVHAFRARASAFGHNAPKKPVFGPNNQIKDPIEWPLSRTVPSGLEKVGITVIAFKVVANAVVAHARATGWVLLTTITFDAGKPVEKTAPVRSGETFTIDLAGGEQVEVAFTEVANASPPFRLKYTFRKRALTFAIGPRTLSGAGDFQQGVEVVTDGTNPTTDTVLQFAPDFRDARLNIQGFNVPTDLHGFRIEGTAATASAIQHTEAQDKISLDNVYEKVVPESWILVVRPPQRPAAEPPGPTTPPPDRTIISRVVAARDRSRADYGISGKVTEVTLKPTPATPWIDPEKDDLSDVRDVAIFAQSEELTLADAPIELPVHGTRIELDGLYPGLDAGRWIIVAGQRHDIDIPAAEAVKLAGTEQTRADVPGDRIHTFLDLASGLRYPYKPASVTIYGNVVRATHGETRGEVLGSGDASRPLQEFQLKQFPLTHIAAPTPTGTESSLNVRVNGILWHEASDLSSLGPHDRAYLTRTSEDSKTTVVFGNGVRGARVPSGVENIKAVYRTGIGRSGNVAAEQISLLSTKPLGVKAVVNPIRASGGADPESRDAARRNAPLAVMSLDRLVSVQDYSDFARTFGGVGKASATTIGARVHVTIAGEGGIAIDESSDVFRNLVAAFGRFGDPQQPIKLRVCEVMFIVIRAKLAVQADYQFESVEPQVRARLLSAFNFESRELGQSVNQSEILAVIQAVEGVDYVDLDPLGSIAAPSRADRRGAAILPEGGTLSTRLAPGGRTILPAQVAFLTPDVSATLTVTELTKARPNHA